MSSIIVTTFWHFTHLMGTHSYFKDIICTTRYELANYLIFTLIHNTFKCVYYCIKDMMVTLKYIINPNLPFYFQEE